jgi:hypothetical protein
VKTDHSLGLAGKFASVWIGSKLTPLVIAGSLLLGAFAVWKLPREEEPQIIVPMVDVFVQMPGASAREVEGNSSGGFCGLADICENCVSQTSKNLQLRPGYLLKNLAV